MPDINPLRNESICASLSLSSDFRFSSLLLNSLSTLLVSLVEIKERDNHRATARSEVVLIAGIQLVISNLIVSIII